MERIHPITLILGLFLAMVVTLPLILKKGTEVRLKGRVEKVVTSLSRDSSFDYHLWLDVKYNGQKVIVAGPPHKVGDWVSVLCSETYLFDARNCMYVFSKE